MEIIRVDHKICPCCMEEHDVIHVKLEDTIAFNGVEVSFEALYEYCSKSDEYWSNDEYTSKNDISMKDAYRRKLGLLTSDDLRDIRKKYGISQLDLDRLLGFRDGTMCSYESHKVQSIEHDILLRRFRDDPK